MHHGFLAPEAYLCSTFLNMSDVQNETPTSYTPFIGFFFGGGASGYLQTTRRLNGGCGAPPTFPQVPLPFEHLALTDCMLWWRLYAVQH